MNAWIPVVAGLWIGDSTRPFASEFDAILSIAAQPPSTDDKVRHRHLPPVGDPYAVLDAAIAWIVPRWMAGRRVLVASLGYRWAELAVAGTLVHLGASCDEAVESLRAARAQALSDPRFIELLWGA